MRKQSFADESRCPLPDSGINRHKCSGLLSGTCRMENEP